MATSALNLHSGGQLVTYDELKEVKTPQPEGRWFPIGHATVLDTVKSTLGEAGFEVRDQKLALDHDGARFFGTLDLGTVLVPGVSLAVGIRNSTDRSLSQGFVAGNRVFVCSNMSFRSDLLVSRKHTRHGQARFSDAIAQAVVALGHFKTIEAKRIRQFMETEVSNDLADALLLRGYERGIISTHQLPHVIKEWRDPTYVEFKDRTLWSLFNCVTTILGQKTRPAKQAVLTMRLNSLLEIKDAAEPQVALAS
jgi:hypothetical protein